MSRIVRWINKSLTHNRDSQGDFGIRVIIHIPIGIFVGISWLIHWVVPLCLAWVLVRYEENEDVHTKDQAWKDYYGCLVGIIIGGIASAIVKVLVL